MPKFNRLWLEERPTQAERPISESRFSPLNFRTFLQKICDKEARKRLIKAKKKSLNKIVFLKKSYFKGVGRQRSPKD